MSAFKLPFKRSCELPFAVDAVYMWVDNSCQEWQERKERKKKEFAEAWPDVEFMDTAARYRDNGELRYSLRSLSAHAPWINRVFLVTDGQCPDWLDTSRVSLVHHRDILPQEATYPVFNNRPVEMCLHRISGLGERFITLNDDFMFGRFASPKLFFTDKGVPKVWVQKIRSTKERLFLHSMRDMPTGLHMQSVRHAHQVLFAHCGLRFPYSIGHYPRSATKSSMESFWKVFPDEVARTLQSPFRTATEIGPYPLYLLYLLASRQGEALVRNTRFSKIYERLFSSATHIESCLGQKKTPSKMQRIMKRKPVTFCLNDTELQENHDLNISILQDFLRSYFPQPSPFEKTA